MRKPIACILFFAAALLAGCQPKPAWHPKALSFTRYQPIYMDVGVIETTDEYKSPGIPPYVEHLMPYSPAEAMHIWVNDRLKAVGADKTLQVIIKDGSVKATTLPAPQGVESMLGDRDTRYDARLEVELRIYGSDPMSLASVHASATRSVTISARAGVAERDAAFRRMISAMMEQLNAELEQDIFQYFGKYISYSHSP